MDASGPSLPGVVSWPRRGGHGIVHSGGASRVDARIARHVLEVMQGLHESSDTDRHILLRSTCEQFAVVPEDMTEGHFG